MRADGRMGLGLLVCAAWRLSWPSRQHSVKDCMVLQCSERLYGDGSLRHVWRTSCPRREAQQFLCGILLASNRRKRWRRTSMTARMFIAGAFSMSAFAVCAIPVTRDNLPELAWRKKRRGRSLRPFYANDAERVERRKADRTDETNDMVRCMTPPRRPEQLRLTRQFGIIRLYEQTRRHKHL